MSRTRAHGWIADKDGCGYYRVLLPFYQMAQNGYDVTVDEAIQDNFKGIVVGQRVCKIRPSTIWQRFANRSSLNGDKGDNFLVYEVDDDLFNVDPSNESPYYFFTHPEIADNLRQNIQIADMVTVSTEPLAELVRKISSKADDDVVVLPNYIDGQIITLPKPVVTLNDQAGKMVDMNKYVTIGYTSSPTHQMDFATVADQLALLAERDQRVVYVWVGERYNLPVKQMHVGWIPIGMDYYKHINFDIGIAPLANHRFNDAKSHIKALEYASQGIPVVASDQPPYRDFVQHGKTGFLAKTPYDFFKYLRELVSSETLRKEMGHNARQYAKQWTIQVHWPKWVEAYGLQKPATVKTTSTSRTTRVDVPACTNACNEGHTYKPGCALHTIQAVRDPT